MGEELEVVKEFGCMGVIVPRGRRWQNLSLKEVFARVGGALKGLGKWKVGCGVYKKNL